ncbi:site-specific integrase [Ketogulonicigenium vulgare]|uniref:site-specific integrase n=1 Tax=Ketogulonicigenium vulgare TaxID=92945 RepID=UPI00235A047A|nr:DUF6538 domain-containing protein [Ketogulonicigenium vulgare]
MVKNMAGMPRKAGQRYLVLRHNRWWFRRAIPARCQTALGLGVTYSVKLETSDLTTAQRFRNELERATSALFEDVLAGKPVDAAQLTARAQGLLYRDTLAELEDDGHSGPDGPLSAYDAALWSLDATVDAFKDEDDRDAFLDALHGRETVDAHLEDYLKSADFAAKTRNDRRGSLAQFARWAAEQRPALTVDKIRRKQAGAYVSKVIDEMHPATQKKHLSALRGYWRWLAARGHIKLPTGEFMTSGWPWDGQQVVRRGKRAERGGREEERAFTRQ